MAYFQKNKFIFLFVTVILISIFSGVKGVEAAARTWDGGGTDGTCGGVAGDGNKWSCAANWSTDTAPTSADSVTFDGTSTKDATIDASFQGTIVGMTISAGYSGTITQARTLTINGSYSQAAGTFTGGSQTIDLNGSFALSGGIFTATSGTWTISNDFTVTNSPTYNGNSGTITFDGGVASTIGCNGKDLSTVNISKSSDFWNVNISSGCTITITGSSPTSTGQINNSGTINVGSGTWTITGGLSNSGTISSTLSKIDLNTSTGIAGSYVANIGSSITMSSPTIEVDISYTYNGGTTPNVDLIVAGAWTGSVACGSATYNSITFSKSHAGVGVTIGATCNLTLPGSSPTSTSYITNNGTLNVGSGTWTLNGGLINNGTVSTTLTKIDINAGSGTGHFTANTGSSLTMSGSQLELEGNFTYTAGTIPTFDLTLNGIWTAVITCGSSTFNSLAISKNNGTVVVTFASSCSSLPSLGNSPTTSGSIVNNGTMTVGTGTWTSNGGITNNGTINTSLSLLDINWNSGSDYFTSNIGSTLTMSTPTMTIATAFIYNGGTLPANINLTLDSVANTLTCGAYTLGSLTISLVNSAFTITPGSDCTIAGNFSMTTGNVSNPASAKTWTIGGNISTAGGPTLGGANLTLEMNGGVDKTISSSITIASKLKINKTSATVTPISNITLGSTMVVAAGTFDLHGKNFTCGGSFTVQSGASLQAFGSETTTAPTFNSGSTMVVTGDGDLASDTIVFTGIGTSFYNLTINSSDGLTDTFTLGASTAVSNNLTITAGAFSQGATYDLTTGAVSVASGTTFSNNGTGDLTLSSGFANSGTVTMRAGGSCGSTDSIVISSSSSGAQRSWTGSGKYYMSDVSVSDMGGSSAVYVGSGTNTSGNGANWHFSSCQTFTQNAYRWYENSDSVQPGSALGSESTASVLPGSNSSVRLRMNVTTDNILDYAGDRSYKLQYAVNTTSGPWVDLTSAWWDSSWLNRKKFTFDNSSSNSSLTNFPVLVTLTTSNFDYSKTRASGQDLRFIDADGSTALNYEIESWNASGNSYIWVKVPQIDAASASDSIWMYYNNSGASDAQSATNVWDSSFAGVYHLPDGSTLSANDSTASPSNGTLTNSPTAASGQIDGAGSFASASTQYVSLGTASKLNPSAITISGWVKATSFPNAYNTVVAKDTGSVWSDVFVKSTGKLAIYMFGSASVNYDGTGTNTLVTGTWYYISATYSSSNGLKGYVNGVLDGTAAANGALANNTAATRIADGVAFAGRNWNGQVDEVRISNAVRSADWIKAEYKTETGTLGNFGPQETYNTDLLHNTWMFKNNTTPTTGTVVSSSLLSSSTVSATYQEDNPTIVNASDVLPAENVEFDFALVPTSRVYLGTTYYFRLVKSDGTPLDNYSNYAQLAYGNLSAGGGGGTGGSTGGGTPTSGGTNTGGGGTGGSTGGGTPTSGGTSGGGGATP